MSNIDRIPIKDAPRLMEAAAEGVRNGLDGLNGSNGLEMIDTNKKILK